MAPAGEAALPGGPPAPPRAARRAARRSRRASRAASHVPSRGARSPVHRRVVGGAQEGRVADSEPADPGCRRRADRLLDRRRLPLRRRPRLQASRPAGVLTVSHVPLVRHQHLLRAREQGEDQSRAPDHVHEPGAAFPPGRRPDRAGDRDEGGPEGPDREARPAGLRPREHGHDRRGLDGREEHAGRHRLRRRRARSPSRSRRPRSTGSSTPAAATASARARRSSTRSASP